MGTILSCESVIKQYRQYDTVVTAVNRANFTVQDKEFVAIIGASGSGKSTLLQIARVSTCRIRGGCSSAGTT